MARNSPTYSLVTRSHVYEVACFRLSNLSISNEYEINLTLINPKQRPVISERGCLESDAFSFHGYITTISEAFSDNVHRFNICLCSPLSYFLSHCNTRVYSNLSLSSLIETLLTEAGLKKSLDFELNLESDHSPIWIQQLNESTLIFLYQIMHQYGLRYNYVQTKDSIKCIFADNLSHITPENVGKLTITSDAGFSTSNDSFQKVLARDLKTHEFSQKVYDPNSVSIHSKCDHTDFAYNLGQWVSYESHHPEPKLKQLLSSESCESISLVLHDISFQPGQAVSIEGGCSAPGTYFVKTIEITGMQESAMGSKKIVDQVELQRAKLTVEVQLAKSFSGLPTLPDSVHDATPIFHSAQIEHNKSAYPDLSNQGGYHIRLLHDTQSHEANCMNPKAQASFRVRNALYFSGNHYGLSAPFQDGSEVLIGYANGFNRSPVILGGFFNQNSQPIVSEKNKFDNLLGSATGNRLLFQQKQDTCRVELIGAKGEAGLSLEQTGDEADWCLYSRLEQMKLSALDSIRWAAEQEIHYKVHHALRSWLKGNTQLSSEQGNQIYKSKTSVTMNGDQNIRIEGICHEYTIEDSLSFAAKSTLEIYTMGKVAIRSTKGIQAWEAKRGSIRMVARNTMRLKGGCSLIQFSSEGIVLQTGGAISINSGSITGI